MKFKKYSSIENSYRLKEIERIKAHAFNQKDIRYVVQEKVHGANFSFWTDGNEVRCAKRTAFLDASDSFYNFQKVLARYYSKILESFKISEAKEQLVLYGELFGGNYPHKDVEPVKEQKTIQKGVFYNPDVDFYVYDAAIDGKLVDQYTLYILTAEIGLGLFAHDLSGKSESFSFEEALEFDPVFESGIYKFYDLPKLENNMAEGVVIKPFKPLFYPNGERVILKNKNPKFGEKVHQDKKPKPTINLSEEGNLLMDDLMSYLNENRLRNVLSKIGQVTQKDFGKIMREFTSDAMDDFDKENKASFDSLAKEERKVLTKTLSNEAATLIRNNFANIIDGNF